MGFVHKNNFVPGIVVDDIQQSMLIHMGIKRLQPRLQGIFEQAITMKLAHRLLAINQLSRILKLAQNIAYAQIE